MPFFGNGNAENTKVLQSVARPGSPSYSPHPPLQSASKAKLYIIQGSEIATTNARGIFFPCSSISSSITFDLNTPY